MIPTGSSETRMVCMVLLMETFLNHRLDLTTSVEKNGVDRRRVIRGERLSNEQRLNL
jgi:hypothetical protein